MWQWLYRWASPKYFYQFSNTLIPWFSVLTLICLSYGIVAGLLFAPADYQQGDGFRIIYVHVPSAFLSMNIYVVMALSAACAMIWRIKLYFWFAKACAPIGACFTFLALVTGAIWGKPMWGTWWIWDARLTSELVLLFLYLGVMLLQNAIDDKERGYHASGLLAIVGLINIPIIHFSVEWWNTLHQGATLSKFAKPSIHPDMLWPLLAMIAGFFFYFLMLAFMKTRSQIIEDQQKKAWLNSVLEKA